MHIPDGYLGPPTCGVMYAVMIPLWAAASRVVKTALDPRQLPQLALGAAFCFLIMMFNVPVVGGTTGHAVGAALAAIVLGPWGACICLSVALAIQALLFGDGGISTLGANCFNMAFVMPFVGHCVYRALSTGSPADSKRRWLAAGAAGYISITAGAVATGVELGLQPTLAHDAAGRALYCPYSLGTSLAAMAGGHLLFFGWVEGAVTALVVSFLGRAEPGMVDPDRPHAAVMARAARYWVALAAMALACPVGIILPHLMKAGDAWGEWAPEDVGKAVGYVPAGLKRLSALWSAPIPDYAPKTFEGGGLARLSGAYVVSAVLGVAACVMLLGLVGRRLLRRKADVPRAPGA